VAALQLLVEAALFPDLEQPAIEEIVSRISQ
jgi:hypothetical protein